MIHYLARCHIHRAISHIHLRVIHTCHRVIFGSRRSSCYRSRSGRCLSFGRRSGITTTCKYERREDDELQPMNMTKRYKSSSKRNEISMSNSRTILDEVFLLSSSCILELANRAYTLFKGSQISKKRELINFIFANLEVDGSNLVYKIKEPFNELLFCGQS